LVESELAMPSPLILILFLFQDQTTATDNGLFGLLLHASLIAKFVLLILLAFSLVSWALIFIKGLAIREAERTSADFLKAFQHSASLSEVSMSPSVPSDGPLPAIFDAANKEIRTQTSLTAREAGVIGINLPAIQRTMQSAAINETARIEQSLSWLASTASASPFIGLFGTVVGIIIAFEGLSRSTGTSIQAVAPGIAEALIATAAGIAAAVPAVLAYNYFVNRIKRLTAEMDSFALRLLNLIEREFGTDPVRKR